MKSNGFAYLLCAGLAAVTAGNAQAKPVKYVFTGIIDLNLGGMNYNNVPLTFTGIGDPSNSHVVGGNTTFTPLSMLSADVTGYGIFPVPNAIYFFSNPTTSTAGFFDSASVSDILTFTSPALAGYDGKTPLPPTSVSFSYSNGFDTPYGKATILNFTNGAVSASAVPEPATWAMMIVGLGAVGAAMRGRRVKDTRPALA